jgi:hypothetical protein
MIEMIGDIHVNTHKKQENILLNGFNHCIKRTPGADPGFQVRGDALKKIAPSGGRRESFLGYFV